jgi:hypothetical protein
VGAVWEGTSILESPAKERFRKPQRCPYGKRFSMSFVSPSGILSKRSGATPSGYVRVHGPYESAVCHSSTSYSSSDPHVSDTK